MSSEIIEKRSIFEKHYLNEDGTVTCQVGLLPIHYQKSDSTYEEIDNNFYVNTISNPAYYKFQTTNNIFRIGLAEDLSVDKSFKFALRYDGLGEIYTTIKGYALYDSSLGEYTIFESPSSSLGTIDGTKVNYPNVFNGIDYEVNSNYDRIKEFIYINSRLNIPDPISLGYNPETTYVVIVNKIETNLLELNYTGEELELFESGVKKVYSPKEWAKSARDIDLTIYNHYDETTNEYFFGIPYSEIMVATLPITIDPTFVTNNYSSYDTNNYNLAYTEYSLSSSNPVWYYIGSSSLVSVGHSTYVDSNYDPNTKVTTNTDYYRNYRSAIKFNIIDIPVDKITTAQLKLTKNSSSTNSNNKDLIFTRITQPLVLGTFTDSLNGFNTIASSPIIQTIPNMGTLSSYSVDITSVVIDWLNGVYPNHGIGFYAPSSEKKTGLTMGYQDNVNFYSLGSVSYPYIEIRYTQADAPSNFNGTAMSNGKINWTWQDTSNIETEFRLRDGNDNLIKTLSPNTTSYIEDLLDFDTNYTRKITAYVNNVETGYEISTVKTLPFVPTQIANTPKTPSNNKRAIVKDKNGNTYYAYAYYAGSGIDEIYVKKILPNGTLSTEPIFTSYVANTSGSITNINLAIDSNDYLHLVWQEGSVTTVYRVYNKTSWITKPSFSNSIMSSIAIDSNNVLHIVYRDSASSNIFYKNSSDNFSSSKTVTTLNATVNNIELTVDNNNNPHVVWQSKYSNEVIKVLYSNKTSTNFIAPKWISSNSITYVSDCFEPTIVIDSANNIHVTFRILNNYYVTSYTYIGYVRSINLGNTFTSVTEIEKLNTGTGTGNGYTQSPNALAIDKNKNVYLIFSGTSSSSTNNIQIKYIKLSYVDGSTWTINRTVVMQTYSESGIFSMIPTSRYSTFNNNFSSNISFMYTKGMGSNNLYYYEIAPDKPLVPDNFNSSSTTLTSITWNWTDVSEETGYKVMDGATVLQTLGAGVTNWTETGLSPNQPYTRQLVAFNDAGNSTSIEAIVSTKPLNPPTGLFGTPLSSSKIEWTFIPYYEAIEYFLYDINDNKIGRIIKEGIYWNVYLDSNPSQVTQYYPSGGYPKFLLSRKLPLNPNMPLNASNSYAIKVSSRYSSTESILKSVSSAITNPIPTFNDFRGTTNALNSLSWNINK